MSQGKDDLPSFEDLKREFREFKDYVVSKVRYEGQGASGPQNSGPSPNTPGAGGRADSGASSRWGKSSGDWEDRLEEKIEGAFHKIGQWLGGEKPMEHRSFYDRYKDKILTTCEKKSRAMPASISSYLGVNSLLFFINFVTNMSYPWFLWPLVPWGMGLISDMVSLGDLKKRRKELLEIPTLGESDARLLKDYHQSRGEVGSSITGFLSISAIMALVIGMTGAIGAGWWLWLLIPPAFGLLNLFGKIGEFFAFMAEKGRGVKELFRKSRGPSAAPKGKSLVEQAEFLRQDILKQVKNNKDTKALLGEDMVDLLGQYVQQITQVSTMEQEVARLIEQIPFDSLEKDEVRLQIKKEKASSVKLAAEYDKSIVEIERQKKSYQSLKEQHEILALRANSSLNSLKQIQLDIVRMRTLRDGQESPALSHLREKSQELNQYIQDFQEGLDEL